MAQKKKPIGARAGWRLRQSKVRFENKIFTLRKDRLELPNESLVEVVLAELREGRARLI